MRKYEIKKAIESNNFEEVKQLILEGFEEEENKKYFGGCELSKYEIENNRISYSTMAKCFDGVLCNNITEIDEYLFDNVESGSFEIYYYNDEELTEEEIQERIEELESKDELTTEEEIMLEELQELEPIQQEIFQYYLVESNALYLLKEANEIVLYSEVLDCYVWGVTHYGTSWNMILTSIKVGTEKK